MDDVGYNFEPPYEPGSITRVPFPLPCIGFVSIVSLDSRIDSIKFERPPRRGVVSLSSDVIDYERCDLIDISPGLSFQFRTEPLDCVFLLGGIVPLLAVNRV